MDIITNKIKNRCSEYKSDCVDLKKYFYASHVDIKADPFLNSCWWNLQNAYYQMDELIDENKEDEESKLRMRQLGNEIREIEECFKPYWIEEYKYKDADGQARCRVSFMKKNTVDYNINVIYRRLVDICHKQNLDVNGTPLIGPHNYDAFKEWFKLHILNQ